MALRTGGVDAIHLLSDGASSSSTYTDDHDILRHIKKINQTRRVAIHCVSVGNDSDLLRQLAARDGGTYVME